MLSCLYASDYGPRDAHFDPVAASASWAVTPAALAGVHNADALQAVGRKLDRGETVTWCDQGYGWTQSPAIDGFFLVLTAVLLPYAAFRLLRRSGLLVRISAAPVATPRE